MNGFSTLEEIEADLRFCEDVLKNKAQLASVSANQMVSPSAALQHGPAGRGSPAPPTQQHAPEQRPSPSKHTASPSKRAGPAAANAAKARTTDELLALMSSLPAGQPFEIDTRLLYSPQSSFAGGGGSSPNVRTLSSDSQAWEELLRHEDLNDPGMGADCGQQFVPPAYRPTSESGRAAYPDALGAVAALNDGVRSQQNMQGPPSNSQQQQIQQQRRSRGLSGQRSPGIIVSGHRSGGRPSSAPHRGSGGSRSIPVRQLKMEEALRDNGVAELLRQGRDERITQLAQPRTALWQQCAHIRVQEENAELQECTFKPRTGRPPSRQRLAPGVPVEERLQLAQAGRREALERARVEKEREEMVDCTFAPQLVTQPEWLLGEEYTPLHRRLGQEQRKRGTKMAQAQLKRDLGEADLTFQPQLNQRSLKLAAERGARELFQDRQHAAAGERRPASAGPFNGGSGASNGACTFSPTINAVSQRLLEDSETVPSDFQQRLRYYSLRKQLKHHAAAEAADAEACTFRPDTGNAVQVLALSTNRAGYLLESEQERYERLAREDAACLAARRAAKEAEVYGSLQFKPQLNPRSVAMAPSGSGGVQGLASLADRQRQRLQDLRQQEEERLRAECTFRPDIRKPRVMGYHEAYQPPQGTAAISIAQAAKQGFDGLTQRIADYNAQREARAAAVKAEQEAKQLAECSFAPDINRQTVQAKGPVVVRGLDRYLELKQLADRQKAEAEERAAKVFNLNPRAKQGATVPQPFQLAGHALLEAKAAEKQALLLENTLRERMRSCTFRPQTNHQKRQQELQRILGQPSVDDMGNLAAAGAGFS